MRLEIRDFRLVVAITELGTLTRAGQQLNLTQSALSHQLADLERRLGASLFERSGRRMIPNRLGSQLASRRSRTIGDCAASRSADRRQTRPVDRQHRFARPAHRVHATFRG